MTFACRIKTTIALAAALAVGLAALMATGSGVPAANAVGACANRNAPPNEASEAQFRKSIVCLINLVRVSRGRDAVKGTGSLKNVAANHTEVMLSRDCFEHECGGEGSIKKRLQSAGYLQGSTWAFGENIGYESTPKHMMNQWMQSSYHRHNILNRKFQDIGVGAGDGAPTPQVDDSDATTWTVILGFDH